MVFKAFCMVAESVELLKLEHIQKFEHNMLAL